MKMKLGMKIGLSFGSLILIACILGGIAVTQMNNVSSLSKILAHEYAPEVDVAYKLDRYARRTMYAMRGYGFTEEKAFLEAGQKDLGEVNKYLAEAEELAVKAENLVKLKGQVKEAQENVLKYEKLVDETIVNIKALNEDRAKLDANAKIYMDNANAFLASQNEAMKKEAEAGASAAKIKERLQKITWVNDVIDLGNSVRLANWKAQAQRKVGQVKEALKYFELIEGKLDELSTLTRHAQNIKEIQNIRDAGNGYKNAMQGLLTSWTKLDELGSLRNDSGAAVTAATRTTITAGLEGTNRIATETVSSLGRASTIMIWGLVAALILGVVIALVITRSITSPIKITVEMLKEMSEGNISGRLEMANNDEIGQMAAAMDTMADSLTSMIKDIDSGVATLSSSSTEMSAIATQMSSGAETTVSKSNTVSAAAEEMNTNMSSVAAAMEEASTNIGTVASGTEEMSASIAEISQNTATARDSVNNAVDRSQKASAQVNELGQAAEEISVVTETIKSISDKTNLLALNATIEAARAGEAGKGFAVVANEIKELAKQTADATEDIAAKLQGIQSSTSMTVTEIEEVSSAIHQVDEIVNAIAAAVEQQNASTAEISENVGQASMGLQEINENVTQSATASGEIASEIAEVNEAAGEMSNSSAQVEQTSSELSTLAEQLKGLMGQFKV